MKKTIEENGEKLLSKYTINCIPFGTGRFLGELFITDKALYYDSQYDMSLDGILNQVVTSAVAASGHALLVSPEIRDQWKSKGYLYVSKSDIKEVIAKKSFFKKTVTVVLKDDETIVFDYGMLGVDGLAKDLSA